MNKKLKDELSRINEIIQMLESRIQSLEDKIRHTHRIDFRDIDEIQTELFKLIGQKFEDELGHLVSSVNTIKTRMTELECSNQAQYVKRLEGEKASLSKTLARLQKRGRQK